LIQLRLFS